MLPLLFFATTLSVLASNSNQVLWVAIASELRFAMYALLIVVCVITARAFVPLPLWVVPVIGGLIAFSLTSTLWSITPSLTVQRGIGLGLLVSAAVAVAQGRWRRGASTRRCLAAICLATTAFLVAGLLLAASGSSDAWDFGYVEGQRLMGFLVSPNSVGVVVGTTAPIALALWRTSRAGPERVLWGASLVIGILSLALSQSRGGGVALVGGVVAYVALDVGLRRGFLVSVVALLTVFSGAFFLVVPQAKPAVVTRLESRFQSEIPNSGGGSGRTAAWALAVDIWKERPVSGWGFGSAEAVFGPRSIQIEQVFQGENPHNSYFNILLELGPGGVLFLGLAAFAAVATVLRTRTPLGAGVGGAVAASLIVSMFESGLTAPGSFLGFLFWFALAGAWRLAGREVSERANRAVTAQQLGASCAF